MYKQSPTPSIQVRGGIEIYLNKFFQDKDSMFRFKHFVHFIETGMNKADMARAFGVSRQTVNKWVKVYDAEQSIKQAALAAKEFDETTQ